MAERSKWVMDLESVVNSVVKGVETFFGAKQGTLGAPGTGAPGTGSPDSAPTDGSDDGPSPCPDKMELEELTGKCVPIGSVGPGKKGMSPVIWIGLAVAGVAAGYFIIKRTTKK